MTKIYRLLITIASLIVVLVTIASAYTVDIRSNYKIGDYLVNEKGMTLYYFVNDSPKISTCYVDCSATWPAFHVESINIPKGLKYSDFDQIGRVDGLYQTTYKGRPLYLYAEDNKIGDINGEGKDGMWFAMRP
jgi:predicted lipoprotein with Yx(FWY)xxD motif